MRSKFSSLAVRSSSKTARDCAASRRILQLHEPHPMVLHIQIDGLGNLRPGNDGAESPVFPTCRAHRLPMKLRLGCALLLASWGLSGRDLVRIPAQEYDTVD